jgi:hypothetical protein
MSKKFALSAVTEAVAVISPKLTSTVVSLFKSEETKIATIRINQDKAIQAALDAMLIACDKPKALFLKGNAKTNAARGQIGKMFDDIVTVNLTQGTANSYKSAFWIAFEQGIPFQRDLNNKKSTGNDAGNTKTETPKVGTVTQTNVPELHKTLSKALAQARILNQTIFAADLIDLIVDTWPDFVETVMTKK